MMENVSCCSCGISFSLSKELYDYRRKDGQTFYCPNGHAQHFSNSARTHVPKEELEKVKRERDNLLRQVEMLEAQLAEKEGKNKGWKLPLWKGKDEE